MVSDVALNDWLSALEAVTGKAPRRSGDEYRAPCPAHDGKDYNLSVTERDGRVLTRCHSHGCAHEDIRAAVFRGSGCAYRDRDRPLNISPGLDQSWYYYRPDGSLHLTVIRSNAPNGKRIRRDPSGVKPPHPIYAVREVLERQGAQVLVVEGEKTADAAAERFPGYVVTTSCGGSKQAKQSNWIPLAGREVVIWPDADEAGATYARDVEALAREAGAANVRVVELPVGLPKGWDLADPVPDGVEVERILQGRPMLPVVSLGQLYAKPDPEVEWLVQGLLPADGLSLLVAPPKVGKSTLARCLAVAVADGRGWWLGRPTTTGKVLHLVLEERSDTVRDHYRNLNAPENSIYVFVGMAPAQADRLQLLRATVRAIRPALVIIDLAVPLRAHSGRQRLCRDRSGTRSIHRPRPAMNQHMSYSCTMRAKTWKFERSLASRRSLPLFVVSKYGAESLGSTGLSVVCRYLYEFVSKRGHPNLLRIRPRWG